VWQVETCENLRLNDKFDNLRSLPLTVSMFLLGGSNRSQGNRSQHKVVKETINKKAFSRKQNKLLPSAVLGMVLCTQLSVLLLWFAFSIELFS